VIPRDAVLEAGDALLPIAREDEGPIFNEAWEAEAFAMVLALHEAKLFSWSEWTAALAREIATVSRSSDRESDDSYYLHWLAALERIVVDKGATSSEILEARRAAWTRAAEATPHGKPILLANDPQPEGSPSAMSR
jgi:nitrile hydratase accessory protein